jgi:hypothetical protein
LRQRTELVQTVDIAGAKRETAKAGKGPVALQVAVDVVTGDTVVGLVGGAKGAGGDSTVHVQEAGEIGRDKGRSIDLKPSENTGRHRNIDREVVRERGERQRERERKKQEHTSKQ